MRSDQLKRRIGNDHLMGRELYLLALDSIDALPDSISVASKYFICVVAMDARTVDDLLLHAAARKLVRSGGVYFCSWGPGCGVVHDIIDQVVIEEHTDETEHDCISTTWHDDEPLSETLWFTLFVAAPADDYFDDCKSVIAITVSSPESALEIESAFADTATFSEAVLDQERER